MSSSGSFTLPLWRWQSSVMGGLMLLLLPGLPGYGQSSLPVESRALHLADSLLVWPPVPGFDFCARGPRLAGSPAEEASTAHLAKVWRAMGYSVKRQKLAFESWRRDTLFAEAVPRGSDNYQEFRALALYNTPNKVLVTAPLIDAGTIATDSALYWGAVKGKVVMADWPQAQLSPGRLREIVGYANRENVAGLILALPLDRKAGLPALSTGEAVSMPALLTTQHETQALRTWLADERLMASIRLFNYRKPVKALNLVASRGKSTAPGSRLLVITALDQVDRDCANQTTTGSLAATQALAALLQRLGNVNVTIVALNGMADAGQPGLNQWLNQATAKSELAQYSAVLDLTEGVGGDRLLIAGVAEGKSPVTQLREGLQPNVSEAPQLVITTVNPRSDLQAAFTTRGIPVLSFEGGGAVTRAHVIRAGAALIILGGR